MKFFIDEIENLKNKEKFAFVLILSIVELLDTFKENLKFLELKIGALRFN